MHGWLYSKESSHFKCGPKPHTYYLHTRNALWQDFPIEIKRQAFSVPNHVLFFLKCEKVHLSYCLSKVGLVNARKASTHGGLRRLTWVEAFRNLYSICMS